MGVVSILQKRELTHVVFTPVRKFLVDSCAVEIILIVSTIFALTHSFLPAAPSVFNSFWQHLLMVSVGIIVLLASGKPLFTWLGQMIPLHVVSVLVCQEITESGRK